MQGTCELLAQCGSRSNGERKSSRNRSCANPTSSLVASVQDSPYLGPVPFSSNLSILRTFISGTGLDLIGMLLIREEQFRLQVHIGAHSLLMAPASPVPWDKARSGPAGYACSLLMEGLTGMKCTQSRCSSDKSSRVGTQGNPSLQVV